MDHKIIPIKKCKTCNSVLLRIERNDEGTDYLCLSAWHINSDGDPMYQEDIIEGDISFLQRIIADYTTESAELYANSFSL